MPDVQVWVKIGSIGAEWEHMVSDESLNTIWQPLVDMEDDAPDGNAEIWMALAVRLIIEMASGFHMRFSIPVSRYPYLLVWFTKTPYSQTCDKRRRPTGRTN